MITNTGITGMKTDIPITEGKMASIYSKSKQNKKYFTEFTTLDTSVLELLPDDITFSINVKQLKNIIETIETEWESRIREYKSELQDIYDQTSEDIMEWYNNQVEYEKNNH